MAEHDPAPRWRAMRADDLPAVAGIAEAVHPDHPERPAVFAERLALAPAGCLMLAAGSAALGYVLSHPWRLDLGPPALDSLLGALPAAPDAWYLHDIALLPGARGQGHAAVALGRIWATASAAGIRRAMLVAVAGKGPFWAARGFRPAPAPPPASLAGYGAAAELMQRALPEGRC